MSWNTNDVAPIMMALYALLALDQMWERVGGDGAPAQAAQVTCRRKSAPSEMFRNALYIPQYDPSPYANVRNRKNDARALRHIGRCLRDVDLIRAVSKLPIMRSLVKGGVGGAHMLWQPTDVRFAPEALVSFLSKLATKHRSVMVKKHRQNHMFAHFNIWRQIISPESPLLLSLLMDRISYYKSTPTAGLSTIEVAALCSSVGSLQLRPLRRAIPNI